MQRRKNPSTIKTAITKEKSHHYEDESRGRSKPFVPKGIIGTLIVSIVVTLIFVINRLTTNAPDHHYSNVDASDGGPSVGDGGRLRIKSIGSKVNTADKEASSSNQIDDHIGLVSPTTNLTLHMIFSTDCSPFQHWQSYLFFHAALRVRQPGYITRIASGCDEKQTITEKEWHEKHISGKMSRRFKLHLTPHFSSVKDEQGNYKGDYKFFNKPYGLKHFLEYSETMGVNANGEMKNPNVIVILCDPDFLLLRPITDDFSNERETIISPRRKAYFDATTKIVTHGQPFAQTYGLGTQWRKFNLDQITTGVYADESGNGGKVSDSPAKAVDQKDGSLFYPVGPPYIGTASDMYKIAVTWSEFVPRVHNEYPHLLAEMYAYCIAIAHLQLPNILIDSLMISSSGVGGEGWKFIRNIPASETCQFALHPDHSKYPIPSVIHYCQRYSVDKYFYGKRKVPHEIFTCDFPLLVEPPLDLGSGNYLSVVPSGRPEKDRQEMSADKEQMEAFVVCALTRATNEAMVHFKWNHCKGGGNMDKTYDMWAGKDVSKIIQK